MVHIKIKNGLDIPLKGTPAGEIHSLPVSEQLGVSFKSFEEVKWRLLVNIDDVVKIGQPLAEDKSTPGRVIVSPAGGVIKEIRRGMKRVLHAIVIQVAHHEEFVEFSPLEESFLDPKHLSKQQLLERMLIGGCFVRIRQRPFNVLANPKKTPRAIFVKALESAPYAPAAELQVIGLEKEFQLGLNILTKLTSGQVNLVYRKNSSCKAFTHAENVQKHTAEGPHPIANYSLHIQEIAPIQSAEDNLWTLSVLDVISIGYLFLHGRCFNQRVISIAGQGVLPGSTGYFRIRDGQSIASLIEARIDKGTLRFISGDPLTGTKVESEDFMGFDSVVFSVIAENKKRSFLHFFGLGLSKYSFSRAYLSGHLDRKKNTFDFTTNQHGEHRAFIDSSLYDKVMPLNISTMLLVKAVMAGDLELAEELGLLEVDSEDFALPTFVCPSKIEMTEIIKNGLKSYSQA